METKKEYEIIQHSTMSCLELFLVEMTSRNPHGHDDLEIGLILDGNLELILENERIPLKKNDIYIINRYQLHSFTNNGQKNLILAFQIGTDLYRTLSYDLTRMTFKKTTLCSGEIHDTLYKKLLSCATHYLCEAAHYELTCASLLLDILAYIVSHVPYDVQNEKEHDIIRHNTLRINRITNYISKHYTESVSLEAIAQLENITTCHASHFMKKNFGVSFQEYMNNIRFEHAFRLINNSPLSILDVCMETGFSSSRYLNQMFLKRVGCTVKEYRRQGMSSPLLNIALPTDNIQHRLSNEEAKQLLIDCVISFH